MKTYIIYGIDISPIEIEAKCMSDAIGIANNNIEDWDGICTLEEWLKE